MLFKESHHSFDENNPFADDNNCFSAVIEFATKEELLGHALFTRHAEKPEFHQFSLQNGDALMLEIHEGTSWLLLGMIEGADEDILGLGFPEWQPKTPIDLLPPSPVVDELFNPDGSVNMFNVAVRAKRIGEKKEAAKTTDRAIFGNSLREVIKNSEAIEVPVREVKEIEGEKK